MTCPLANSNYATIKCIENKLYLFVKTIERAHTPSKMWEKIKLDSNYAKAIAQIDTELEYWPEALIHRIKQRLTKLTQSLIRTRRLILKTQPELVGIKKKVVRRERKRELKALTAARLETTIEKELLERLRSGVYGTDGILNESQEAFTKALDALGEEQEVEEDMEMEFEEEQEEDQDQEDEDLLDREFVSDFEDSDEDEDGSDADAVQDADSDSEADSSDSDASSDASSENVPKKIVKKKGPLNKRAFVKVEYEMETEESAKQSSKLHEDW